MSHGFATTADEESSDLHVWPVQDIIGHDVHGTDCICGPSVEIVREDDGRVGRLIAHPSLDGREIEEPAQLDT